MSHGGPSGPLDRLLGPVAVAILGLLLAALAVGVAPNFDTRLVGLGESVWPGYAADLRTDPVAPECDLAELDQRLEAAEEVLVLVLPHRVVLDDDGAAADEELVDAVDERQKVLVARAEHERHRAPQGGSSRRRGAKRSAPPEIPVEELTIRESDCLPYEYEGPPMATMGGGGCVIA